MLFWNIKLWYNQNRKLKYLKGLKATIQERIQFWNDQFELADYYNNIELDRFLIEQTKFWEDQLYYINFLIQDQNSVIENISLFLP
jgi:hypothetical protein